MDNVFLFFFNLDSNYFVNGSLKPDFRGFFCNDENLQHPYIEEQTVPARLAAGIWASLGLIILCTGELLRNSLVARPKQVRGDCGAVVSLL